MSRTVAIVTGSSSGIGRAITSTLLANNWEVCGLSRRPTRFDSPLYTHMEVDLTDVTSLTHVVPRILQRYGAIHAVINNAGVGHFAPHEELSVAQIEEMVHLNLLAPLVVTKLFLRSLKESKGSLINIGSFSALESSSHGAAYAATKAGIKHFSDSLFDEVRKSEVKVVTISPDITRTPFYDELSFSPEDDETAAINPECVADSVLHILAQRPGTVTTHIVMRPQRILLKKRRRSD